MQQLNKTSETDRVKSRRSRFNKTQVQLPSNSCINLASNHSRYSQGAELLKKLIQTEKLPKGTQLPSVRDIAKQLKISQHTVCRIIQQLETEGVIYREHGKGIFVNADLTREYSILCLIDHLYPQADRDSYFHDIIAANQNCFSEKGHQYAIKILNNKAPVPVVPTSILGTPKAAGFILGMTLSEKWIRAIQQLGLPSVMVNRHWPEEDGISAVIPDNQDGSKQIAKHLLKLGHNKIAVLCAINTRTGSNFTERREAIMNFWKQHNAQGQIKVWNIDYSDVSKIDVNYDQAMAEILNEFSPSAIVGCSDYSAWHAYQGIERAGLQIPNDISVVGFQDIALSTQLNPQLTTVKVDVNEIGIQAAIHLENCIQGKESCGKIIKTPVKLIIRQSTAVSKKVT